MNLSYFGSDKDVPTNESVNETGLIYVPEHFINDTIIVVNQTVNQTITSTGSLTSGGSSGGGFGGSSGGGESGCSPSCAGKECGDDGCGGSCGTCNESYFCNENYTCEKKGVWYVRPMIGEYGVEDGASYETAFDGLDKVIWSSIQPGDTLYVCGTFMSTTEVEEGRLIVQASGTEDNPILVRGDCPGDSGIIVGAYQYAAANWTDNGDDTFYYDENPGFEPWKYSAYSEAWEGTPGGIEYNLEPKTSQTEVVATDGSFWNDNTIHRYWYNPHGSFPRDVYHRYKGCIINGGNDYITYLNLTLYSANSGSYLIITEHTNEVMNPSEYVTIQDCTFKYAINTAIRGRCVNHLNILDNTFEENQCAIYLYLNNVSSARTNVTIARNIIEGGEQGLGAWRWYSTSGEDTGGILGYPNENWRIENNTITNIQGSAIYTYIKYPTELATNLQIQRNWIYNVVDRGGYGKGIYLGGNDGINNEAYSGAVIAYNIISGVGGNQPVEPQNAGNKLSAGIMLMPADSNDSEDRVKIYNNVVTDAWINYCFRLRNSGGPYRTAFILDNDISYAPQAGGWHLWTTPDFQIYDCEIKNNIWFPDTSGGNNQFTWDGFLKMNFTDFAVAATIDGAIVLVNGSNTSDPLFLDLENGDFHLQENSPAIDAGIDVGLLYSGDAPDIGAYEYEEGSLPTQSLSLFSGILNWFKGFLTGNTIKEITGRFIG